ncbi:MAG: hypothetical protein WCA46_17580 [Actinocatenispora sp.]
MRMTVGPLPATVYWRRRAIVLGAVLLLVILTTWACDESDDGTGGDHHGPSGSGRFGAAPHGSGGSSAPGATPSASDGSPDGSPDGTSGDDDSAADPAGRTHGSTDTGPAPQCSDGDLAVTTRTHPEKVPLGSYPTLYLTIRNTSSSACTVDIGADQQELWITHDGRRMWSSNDCDANHGTDVRRFGPGAGVTFRRAWDSRTSSDGCREARTVVGRGDYQLHGRLGERKGKPVDFTVT